MQLPLPGRPPSLLPFPGKFLLMRMFAPSFNAPSSQKASHPSQYRSPCSASQQLLPLPQSTARTTEVVGLSGLSPPPLRKVYEDHLGLTPHGFTHLLVPGMEPVLTDNLLDRRPGCVSPGTLRISRYVAISPTYLVPVFDKMLLNLLRGKMNDRISHS